jgi:hypothetical protein
VEEDVANAVIGQMINKVTDRAHLTPMAYFDVDEEGDPLTLA